MNTKKTMLWISACLPLVPAALCYSRLPAIIPIHWGLDGQVNGTVPRPMIFLLGAIGLLVTLLMLFSARTDPKQQNSKRNQPLYDSIAIAFNLLILVLMLTTIAESLRPGTLNVGRLATLIVGALYAFIGNLLPKAKQNYRLGIRTSWALSDGRNWSFTNRIGGWLMFFSGIIMIVSSFLLSDTARLVLLFVLVIASTCGSIGASYWYYRQHNV
ncbi:MAG: SdpI family protein [Butyricicoccus sp.]